MVTYGEQQYPPHVSVSSIKTRSLVLAELKDAKAAGLVSYGDLNYPPNVTK